MKYGIITHGGDQYGTNLGDDIQTIAASRFLPRVDYILEREKLQSYHFAEKVFVIVNGWYSHNPKSFPPSDSIVPIIITSFHISPGVAKQMMNLKTISYLKKYQPVGCRDLYTKNLLESHNIEAYFSGCLTLTLQRRTFAVNENKRDGVLLAEVLHRSKPVGSLVRIAGYFYFEKIVRKRLLKKLLPETVARQGKSIYNFQKLPDFSYESRIKKARELLGEYAGARLVITSRLHTALPCLALGTPVLFVSNNQNDERFSGLSDLLNVVTIESINKIKRRGAFPVSGELFNWEKPANSCKFEKLRDQLIEQVTEAVLKIAK